MISATMDIEAPRLLEYIDQVRDTTGQHLTPMHLVGRAAGKVLEALPELNGRVVFGSFLPSPTIDCGFVVSLRTDPVSGAEAAAIDISGAVVRRVDEKPPWVIAKELADRVARIRHNEDPLFGGPTRDQVAAAVVAPPRTGGHRVRHRRPPVASFPSSGWRLALSAS